MSFKVVFVGTGVSTAVPNMNHILNGPCPVCEDAMNPLSKNRRNNVSVALIFESEGVEIGKVLVGNYKSVRFKVGLTPDVNTLEPTTTGYVNLLNQPEMWFSTKAQPDGYVYMNFSGSIDTAAAQTGVKIPFEYKIGTETNRVQIEMPAQNFSIYKDAVGYVHMKIQYDRLFDGINLSNNANLHVITKTDNALPIVETLKKNIQKLFIYEN